MNTQNPYPRTFAELSAMLDAANGRRLGRCAGCDEFEVVALDSRLCAACQADRRLSTAQVRQAAPNPCMAGFSPRRASIGIVEMCNED